MSSPEVAIFTSLGKKEKKKGGRTSFCCAIGRSLLRIVFIGTDYLAYNVIQDEYLFTIGEGSTAGGGKVI